MTTRFGELMGIKDLPTTYDGYLALLVDYERAHFAPDARRPRALAEATDRASAAASCRAPLRPLVRRVSIAIMDEPLRIALGMPEQPAWLGRLVRARPAGTRVPAALRAASARGVPPPRDHLSRRAPALRPRPALHARRPQRPRPCRSHPPQEHPCLSARPSSSRSTRTSAPPPARSWSARSRPTTRKWEADGIVDREVWRKAGEAGLLCFDVEEEYGGAGISDFRYNMVLAEETARVGASGPGFAVHTDIIVPYISTLGTDEQKRRWLPGLVSGELISAIAMTEPGAGSDLQGIRTTAVDAGRPLRAQRVQDVHQQRHPLRPRDRRRRTDPDAGHQGISLLVVERGMEGFERGRNLDKMGLHAQDTAELSFTDVRVPKANLLGEEGSGFISLMENLPQERISIACIAVAAIEHVLELCLAYAKEREAFGKPIGKFQHNRFVLAEMATEAHIARVFVNDCVLRLNAGERRHVARLDGEVVDHRAAEAGRGRGRAAARRLRLHERVPDLQGLHRLPDPDDLRRDHRDPEGDHRADAGAVGRLERHVVRDDPGDDDIGALPLRDEARTLQPPTDSRTTAGGSRSCRGATVGVAHGDDVGSRSSGGTSKGSKSVCAAAQSCRAGLVHDVVGGVSRRASSRRYLSATPRWSATRYQVRQSVSILIRRCTAARPNDLESVSGAWRTSLRGSRAVCARRRRGRLLEPRHASGSSTHPVPVGRPRDGLVDAEADPGRPARFPAARSPPPPTGAVHRHLGLDQGHRTGRPRPSGRCPARAARGSSSGDRARRLAGLLGPRVPGGGSSTADAVGRRAHEHGRGGCGAEPRGGAPTSTDPPAADHADHVGRRRGPALRLAGQRLLGAPRRDS